MYVDDTMITGHLDHARFSGERGGRQQQCLVGENSVRSTGWSTRSLAENAAGRFAKPTLARAGGMRSTRPVRVGCGQNLLGAGLRKNLFFLLSR